MADLYTMEIAGIRFAVKKTSQLALEDLAPVYSPFVKQSTIDPPLPVDIKICLEPGDVNTENLTKIFDSGQSWSMFQGNSNYYISCHPPAFKTPLWVARVDHDYTEVTVYCSEKLFRNNTQILITNPISYPLDQILLMYILAHKHGALIHAAGVNIGERGYIFPGKSGAGKSTIMCQIVSRKGIGLLSDDRIVVRKLNNTFKAYGTPWPGEAGIAVDRSVSLSGIFFLNHATDNRIKEIETQDALKRLLPVTSIPWYDREIMPKILLFCEDLVTHVPTYDLYFKKDADVTDALKEFIQP